jgi:hypothetical protein
MRDNNRFARISDLLKVLKREIKNSRSAEDRRISECMVVVMSALAVGADVDRLVEHTGHPRDFIESISARMRKAGLWIGELVDVREWRDAEEELMLDIFTHAMVAQGTLLREPEENGGCTYLDAETGEWSGEWHPPPAAKVRGV